VLTAVSSDPLIVPDPTIAGTGASRTLSFTPAPGQSGSVTITVRAVDDGGTETGGENTYVDSFPITVTPATTNLVDIELVLVSNPSPVGSSTLPEEIDTAITNGIYFLEVWVQDLTGEAGVQGGYVDVHYDNTLVVDAVEVINEDFSALARGTVNDDAGLIDDLGGVTFSGGVGLEPLWTRLGYVELRAMGTGAVTYSLSPGIAPFALSLVGNIEWDEVDLTDTAEITHLGGAQVDVTLARTQNSTDAEGEVTDLPASELWLHEWEPFWAELWISTPYTADSSVVQAEVTLDYTTILATASRVELGPAFTATGTPLIDDLSGHVSGIAGEASRDDLGDDQYVLFARVRFEPSAADQAAVDLDSMSIGPYDLRVSLQSSQVTLSEGIGSVDAELGPDIEVGVWAVPYDRDDNDMIDVGDFAFFAPVFLQTVQPSEPLTWWADFDCSGFIDVGDFAFFAPSFLKGKPDETIAFSPCYPDGYDAGVILPAAKASSALSVARVPVDKSTIIDLEFVVVNTATAVDQVDALPKSVTEVLDGDVYFVEIWGRNSGGTSAGIQGGFVDVRFDATAHANVVALNHGGVFNQLTRGTIDNATGLVDDFGGVTFASGIGVAPQWARLGWMEMVSRGDGTITFTLEEGVAKFALSGVGNVEWDEVDLGNFVLDLHSHVVGRHVFYDNSAFDDRSGTDANDDRAIDPTKTALLPGETASFANYTSCASGINGIMIDVTGIPNAKNLDAADFEFTVGNNDDPARWTPASTPESITVRELDLNGDEATDVDRITPTTQSRTHGFKSQSWPRPTLAWRSPTSSTSATPSVRRATQSRKPESTPSMCCLLATTHARSPIQHRSTSHTTSIAISASTRPTCSLLEIARLTFSLP